MLVDEEIFCKRNLLIADRRETTSNWRKTSENETQMFNFVKTKTE